MIALVVMIPEVRKGRLTLFQAEDGEPVHLRSRGSVHLHTLE
jgi:hypothetical protein